MQISSTGRAIAALCFCLIASASYAEGAELLWNYQAPSGHIAGSPAVGDANGDGAMDVVVATTGGSIVALSGGGDLLWRQDVAGEITVPPTLADVMAGPGLEVTVVDSSGMLYCLDAGTGGRLWDARLPGRVDWGCTSIAAQDINHDGVVELITGDAEGSVVCLTGEGREVWTYRGPHGFTRCPAVGDLDGDGFPEVVVGGTTLPIVCLSNRGEELWRSEEPGVGSSPVLWDLDGDGDLEVITGIDTSLAALDHEGQILWSVPMKYGDEKTTFGIDSAISVADADGDGAPEVYAVDLTGYFVCVGPDGVLRWDASVGRRARRSPSIADVDGDGAVEILVAGYSTKIQIFSAEGAVELEIPLGSEANSTATVVDLMNDGRPCVICPAEHGGLFAYRWDQAQPGATVCWPEYRLNGARTASMPVEGGQAPVRIQAFDPDEMYVGSNECRVEVANPSGRALTVVVTVDLDGQAASAETSSSEATIAQRLPYTISGREPVQATFSCIVKEGDRILIERKESAYLEPFRKEMADAERRLAQVQALAPRLVDSNQVRGQALLLKSMLDGCRDQIVLAAALSGLERGKLQSTLSEVLSGAEKLRALAETAARLRDRCTGPLLLCAANPWAPFLGMQDAIDGRTPAATLEVKAFHGEHESAAVTVLNFGDRARTFRIEAQDLTPITGDPIPARSAIHLHEVVDIPTQAMDLSADALPLLNQGNLLVVPAWEARQVWLSIDTQALAPGDYAGSLRFRTVEPESLELTADLQLTIWEAALPENQPLNHCNWAYVGSSFLRDQPEAALQDMVAHGTNIFTGCPSPRAQFDESGALVGEIDFSAMDNFVDTYAKYGTVFIGGPGLSGPAKPGSPAYEKAGVAYMRALVAHLAEKGVGYDGFALYPVDEMGLHDGGVETYYQCAKLAKLADPKIRMYTDPAPGVELEELHLTEPFTDIWCPSTGFAFNDELAEKFTFMKNSGKAFWCYACSGFAKHLSPLGYYRGQSWFAWSHGMTGIGFWTYCTSRDDPWFSAPSNAEHQMIYHGKGVVTSKRWEAVRDGVEDYSMFFVLREAARAAKEANRAPEAVKEAESLLTTRIAPIGDCTNTEMPGISPGWTTPIDTRPMADEMWARIQSVRQDVARLIQALAQP